MLRTRFFLNLVPFLTILLAIGVYALVLFARLADNADSAIREKHRSESATDSMGLALSRIDERILLAVEADSKSAERLFEENEALFAKNALQRDSLAGNVELVSRLQTHYQALHQAGTNILSLPSPSEQRVIYEQHFLPNVRALSGLVREIRRLNHEAILAANRTMRQNTIRLMAVGLALALIFSGYACYKLGRSIIEPIRAMTRAAGELGAGNLDQVVRVRSQDELGQLAVSFNKMASQLRSYRDTTAGKILNLHRTMETTLASFPDPIFVLNGKGHIDLKNPAAEELASSLQLGDSLPAPVRQPIHKALDQGKDFLPYDFKEAISFRLEGRLKYYLPRILLMRNGGNTLSGLAVILYDITRFRLMDDLKTNLLATVSHELKTPLTGLRLAVHILLEKSVGPLTPKQEDLLLTAKDDAERLVQMLDEMLNVTNLERATASPQDNDSAHESGESGGPNQRLQEQSHI